MLKINYTIFEDGKEIMKNQNTPLNIAAESIDNMMGRQGGDKRQYVLYFNRISGKEFYQIAQNSYELKRILSELKSKLQYSKVRVMNSRPKYAEKR